MAVIKKWYPNAPDYVSYKRSNWAVDPYALGSYPFMKAGASPKDCENYQEPSTTNNKVFFAGDGTDCDLLGTAQGAYETGLKAAKAAIRPISTSSASGLMATFMLAFTLFIMHCF